MKPFLWNPVPSVTHCCGSSPVFCFCGTAPRSCSVFRAPCRLESPHLLPMWPVPIELICGILVMIGLFTHWAAFIASGQMAITLLDGTRDQSDAADP